MGEVSWLSAQTLAERRAARYRQRPSLRVRNEEEALAFLNDVGLCLLFSAQDVELPTLWGAISGSDRDLAEDRYDEALGWAWEWKDTLAIAGRILYGKYLRKKPVFISLDLVPHFYALSGNYGELDDYLEEYREGRLSDEARRVYEALLEHGALPTSRLRREARLYGHDLASRFERALTELQMGFKIVKVGISDANRWKYCYVYDLFLRRFPEQAAAARSIHSTEAMRTILRRYLSTVIAATPEQIVRLFGWEPWRLEQIVARLAQEGIIRQGVQIEGLRGDHLMLTAEAG
jgi:hypothetical protein